VSATSTTQAVGTRRRQRPYLNWLERSRDNWKDRAVCARADASRLRRNVRSLTASRDHWRAQTVQLSQRLRLALLEKEKNYSGS
jgi:hypothetical protein